MSDAITYRLKQSSLSREEASRALADRLREMGAPVPDGASAVVEQIAVPEDGSAHDDAAVLSLARQICDAVRALEHPARPRESTDILDGIRIALRERLTGVRR